MNNGGIENSDDNYQNTAKQAIERALNSGQIADAERILTEYFNSQHELEKLSLKNFEKINGYDYGDYSEDMENQVEKIIFALNNNSVIFSVYGKDSYDGVVDSVVEEICNDVQQLVGAMDIVIEEPQQHYDFNLDLSENQSVNSDLDLEEEEIKQHNNQSAPQKLSANPTVYNANKTQLISTPTKLKHNSMFRPREDGYNIGSHSTQHETESRYNESKFSHPRTIEDFEFSDTRQSESPRGISGGMNTGNQSRVSGAFLQIDGYEQQISMLERVKKEEIDILQQQAKQHKQTSRSPSPSKGKGGGSFQL